MIPVPKKLAALIATVALFTAVGASTTAADAKIKIKPCADHSAIC